MEVKQTGNLSDPLSAEICLGSFRLRAPNTNHSARRPSQTSRLRLLVLLKPFYFPSCTKRNQPAALSPGFTGDCEKNTDQKKIRGENSLFIFLKSIFIDFTTQEKKKSTKKYKNSDPSKQAAFP